MSGPVQSSSAAHVHPISSVCVLLWAALQRRMNASLIKGRPMHSPDYYAFLGSRFCFDARPPTTINRAMIDLIINVVFVILAVVVVISRRKVLQVRYANL